jgi:hypothetical protein
LKPLHKAASALLAVVLLLGLAGNLHAKDAAASAETPLMKIVGELLGVRYKTGGNTPKGFDCSGFTRYVFEKLAGIDLNRRSIDQAKEGSKIEKDKLREGDLVFFKTNGKSISHVGIYVGDGKFAHASSKKGITITPLDDKYYAKRYVTARRILNDDQYRELASRAEAERKLAEAREAEKAAKRAAEEAAKQAAEEARAAEPAAVVGEALPAEHADAVAAEAAGSAAAGTIATNAAVE